MQICAAWSDKKFVNYFSFSCKFLTFKSYICKNLLESQTQPNLEPKVPKKCQWLAPKSVWKVLKYFNKNRHQSWCACKTFCQKKLGKWCQLKLKNKQKIHQQLIVGYFFLYNVVKTIWKNDWIEQCFFNPGSVELKVPTVLYCVPWKCHKQYYLSV